jgi:hypothetical protein
MNLLALYHILETTLCMASEILEFSPPHLCVLAHAWFCVCVCVRACAYIMSVNYLLTVEIEMEKILAPALFTVF